jgi:hypothetical protein
MKKRYDEKQLKLVMMGLQAIFSGATSIREHGKELFYDSRGMNIRMTMLIKDVDSLIDDVASKYYPEIRTMDFSFPTIKKHYQKHISKWLRNWNKRPKKENVVDLNKSDDLPQYLRSALSNILLTDTFLNESLRADIYRDKEIGARYKKISERISKVGDIFVNTRILFK